jgi:AraC-like DNA-binding protein
MSSPESNVLNLKIIPRPAEVVTLPSDMNCHEHRYAQIVIGLKGRVEFDISGYGNYVGPGQGCVVLSDMNHAFGGMVGSTDILVLNLPIPSEEDPLVLNRLNELSNSDYYFQLDESLQGIVNLLVQEMRAFPDDVALSQACHDTLVTMLFRHITNGVSNVRESRFNMDVIDHYIEQHLNRRISVAQLAGCVFLGESQFHAHFKNQTGMTPHQYVLHKRIEMARSMIEQGGYSLGQIADYTGFSNQSSFSHAFLRLLEITPSAYRKYLQEHN